jgi:hypothetical protein
MVGMQIDGAAGPRAASFHAASSGLAAAVRLQAIAGPSRLRPFLSQANRALTEHIDDSFIDRG